MSAPLKRWFPFAFGKEPRRAAAWAAGRILRLVLPLLSALACGQAPEPFPALPAYVEPVPGFCRPLTEDPASREELMAYRDRLLREDGSLAELLTLDLALDEPGAAVRHFRTGATSSTPELRFLAAVALMRAGLAHEDILTGDRWLREALDLLRAIEGPEAQDPALRIHRARAALEIGIHGPALELLRAGLPGIDRLRTRMIQVSAKSPEMWSALHGHWQEVGQDDWLRELHAASPRSLLLLAHSMVDSLWDSGDEGMLPRIERVAGFNVDATRGVQARLSNWRRLRDDPAAQGVQASRRRLLELSADRESWDEFLRLADAAIAEADDLGMPFEAASFSMGAYWIRSIRGANYEAAALRSATDHQRFAAAAQDPLYESQAWNNLHTALSVAGQIEASREAVARGIAMDERFGFDTSQAIPIRARHFAWSGRHRVAYALEDSLYRVMRPGGRVELAPIAGRLASRALAYGDSARAQELATHILNVGTEDEAVLRSTLAVLCRLGEMDDPTVRQHLQAEIEAAQERGDTYALAALHLTVGDGHWMAGRTMESLRSYERSRIALEAEPTPDLGWELSTRLARAYRERGDLELGLEHASRGWRTVLDFVEEWATDISRDSFLLEAAEHAELLVDLLLEQGSVEAAYRVEEESRVLSGMRGQAQSTPRPPEGELWLKLNRREDETLLWVVGSTGMRLEHLPPFPARYLSAWPASHTNRERFEALADSCGAFLLAPLAESLGRYPSLVWILDGEFARLPMSFLRHDGEWMMGTHSVRRRSTGGEPSARLSNAGEAVWIGYPGSGTTTPVLRAAAAEVERMHARYGGTLLNGPEAGEISTALEASPSLLHISGHSAVDPYGAGYLELWKDGAPARVRATELLEWPLEGVPLVNLSSCQSLAGRGVEYSSLGGAALGAGAHAVLGSLWEIPDRGAAEFGEEFYAEFLGSGSSAAEALQTVQGRWLTQRPSEAPWWAGLAMVER